MLTQVTIQTETIKQANNRPRAGRPFKNQPKRRPLTPRTFDLSDEAVEGLKRAAEMLGVTQNALVEALGRTLSEGQIAA